MPTLGMAKLDAVNRMIYSANERPVGSLDTGGSSIQADAERFLDEWDRAVQMQGWPENTRFFESLAPSGGMIVVSADTLALWSSGPNEGFELVLNGDTVYDARNGTTTLTPILTYLGQTVLYFDRVRKLAFDDCSPKLKELIASTATVYFQQRVRGSATQDAMLQQARIFFEMVTDRNAGRLSRRPINLKPLIELMGPATQNARGN